MDPASSEIDRGIALWRRREVPCDDNDLWLDVQPLLLHSLDQLLFQGFHLESWKPLNPLPCLMLSQGHAPTR